MVYNQDSVKVIKEDNVYTVDKQGNTLRQFTSTNPGQVGDSEWVAILITLNDKLTEFKLGGYQLEQADIDEAHTIGATDDNTLVLWIRAEDAQYISGRTLEFERVDSGDKTSIIVKVIE